ncbi:MAG: hypothetical protein DMG08_26880 [Acidobacteria bacterium]|nr:MAG: hypothetical protein DMG08_26880 [Acidobacteriota bacterium]
MRYCKLLVPALVALLAGAWAPALGQSDRGAITGTVKDPKGGVVPDAKVTATNLESSEVRQAKTTGEGTYILPELKAAPYMLRVEATGFKTATIDKIQVGVQITRHADVTLELGSINESVTVSSDAPVLQTDSPVQQLNVTERQVRELPLVVSAESGGRSPLAFIFLDSSVTPNGATSNGTGTFFSEVAPGPNAFQEFTINSSNYSAEFGNSSGGVINFTIKSGGNDFHGEGYLFLINESVTVSSDAPVLQTDSPVQQLNVTERQVRELPLVVSAESGGRSPLAFIFLDSSVTPNGATSNGTRPD